MKILANQLWNLIDIAEGPDCPLYASRKDHREATLADFLQQLVAPDHRVGRLTGRVAFRPIAADRFAVIAACQTRAQQASRTQSGCAGRQDGAAGLAPVRGVFMGWFALVHQTAHLYEWVHQDVVRNCRHHRRSKG